MAYSELVKNFNRIRDYMREVYVYGFKSRDEYTRKSARSYDDERRRLESWLGDYMQFRQTAEGKNVFISITCSKDYILLRHNDILWQSFINQIMAVNPLSAGSFEIPIGALSVTFTATHLAEIQEIFKNQGWGAKAPKRKAVLGNSVDDEVEQEQTKFPPQAVISAQKKGVAEKPNIIVKPTMSLAMFFEMRGFETIDMRPKGGALWVVGETYELKDAVAEATKLYNLTGTYSNGGKATNFRNGWFTKSKA